MRTSPSRCASRACSPWPSRCPPTPLFRQSPRTRRTRRAPAAEPAEPTGPYGVLNAVLDELVACGAVTPERRAGADVACWAMVHGFADLSVHGPLHAVPAELREPLLEVVLDVVERGLVSPTP